LVFKGFFTGFIVVEYEAVSLDRRYLQFKGYQDRTCRPLEFDGITFFGTIDKLSPKDKGSDA